MVKLYLDENIDVLLAILLRARNINVITTVEAENLGKSDPLQLEYSISNSLSITTHNRVDFENLYKAFTEKAIGTYNYLIPKIPTDACAKSISGPKYNPKTKVGITNNSATIK